MNAFYEQQRLHCKTYDTYLIYINKGDNGFIDVPLVSHSLNKSCLAHLLSHYSVNTNYHMIDSVPTLSKFLPIYI